MSGIENLAIFLATTTSTLLGFVAIVFFFWAKMDGRWTRDRLRQNKWIVKDFRFLMVLAIGILIICFVTLYNAIVDPGGEWELIFLNFLMIGFIVWIIFMSLFFVVIINSLMGSTNSSENETDNS